MAGLEKPAIDVSIIGCGDIGYRVATRLQQEQAFTQQQITGYTRNNESLKRIASIGIGSQALDLDTLNIAHPLTIFSQHIVFYFAPPPARGTVDSRFRSWLAALDKAHLPKRILYISTTGVYGDHQGSRIDEKTATKPQADRAKRRLDAETALTEFAREQGIEFIILRVAGIYGKNRLPVKRLTQQTPILQAAISPLTNRIHEDDLAQICVTAALKSDSGEIYNVSDGDNVTMSDYFIQVAEHLNLPTPPMINWQEAEATLSAGMLSYLRESRLIDNKKILQKLNIVLRYPCLKDFFIYNKT